MKSNNQYKRGRMYNKSSLSILVLFLITFSFNCVWADSGNSISTYIDTIQKIFIGYYQRPADPEGLLYWAARLDARAGNLNEIIEAFANSAESQALYGTINSSNISTVVNSTYNALFGRSAEAAGLSYYVNGFNSGQFTASTIMLNVLNGAQNEDLLSVNNKLTAANLFTKTIDPELDGVDFQATYSGDADAGKARTFLSTITFNPVTIPNQAEVTAYIKTNIADSGDPIMSYVGKGSPQFRAIGGVSMGAYGAMNIGLGRPDFFNTIASLGGPLDMAYLLKFIEVDMLGNYDNPSAYPNRDTLIDMLKDLTISFGNPVYYNPLSTYYPPGITAQNARIPTTLYGFIDDLNPTGSLSVITYEDPDPGDWVEVLLALDYTDSISNGKRDLGEPILRQFQEPFTDSNRNGIYDPGEPFSDTGLDGVSGTGDRGEGDGKFTYNPNHNNFLAEDPLSRAETLPLTDLQNLNLYIDAGTEDEFQFNIHADNFVRTLQNPPLSLFVRIENGFPEDFPGISHFDEKRGYVRYSGGHVGFNKENIGLSFEQAKQGIEEAVVVANRFTTLFSFVSDHFSGGDYGTDPYKLYKYPSKMGVAYFNSSSLNTRMKFGIYLPPGYSRSRTNYYPVLYLLLGYNMSVDGMTNSWIKAALDGFILTGEMQKMIIVIPDGLNYKNQRGHFFVNQIDQERGDNFKDYFFDLVTFIDTFYKTK